MCGGKKKEEKVGEYPCPHKVAMTLQPHHNFHLENLSQCKLSPTKSCIEHNLHNEIATYKKYFYSENEPNNGIYILSTSKHSSTRDKASQVGDRGEDKQIVESKEQNYFQTRTNIILSGSHHKPLGEKKVTPRFQDKSTCPQHAWCCMTMHLVDTS